MRSVVKVSSKGQVTLPAAVRHKAGIGRGDVLAAGVGGGKVVLEPLKRQATADWQEILQRPQASGPTLTPITSTAYDVRHRTGWRRG